jgi:hypothetical protein
MRQRAAQRFLGFWLPSAMNAGLALWILWRLAIPGHARQVGFGAFVWLYAMGGLAIVLSCASAFFLLAVEGRVADMAQRRRWLMLALINTTIPSILLLLLLLLR